MKNIFKFISTSMRPENDQNSDFPKKYQIEPQLKLQKEPFQPLLTLKRTISHYGQYCNDFLQQDEYYKQNDNILRQFNLLTQDKKGQIIRKLEFIIQILENQKQIQDQDPAKIKKMRLSFRQFKHDLVNSKRYNESNKQGNQSVKERTKCQRLKLSISKKQIIKAFGAILLCVIVIPQYEIFQGEWDINKIIILSIVSIVCSLILVSCILQIRKQWKKLLKQQKQDLKEQESKQNVELEKRSSSRS